MYQGFNIKNISFSESASYKELGHKEKSKNENLISEIISKSINGIINGDEMQANWFPQIEADIFISHSHKDEHLAISIAGWLKESFGLRSFIDSTIWGYSDKLLKVLDDNYCYKEKTKTYSYETRNLTTAHVHLMLCSALSKIMDSCECLFFLNTPNSISSEDVVKNINTFSPWLYYELGISKLIQKPLYKHSNRPSLIKGKIYSQLNESERQLLINYSLETRHLKTINADDLNKWKDEYTRKMPRKDYPLDVLYEM